MHAPHGAINTHDAASEQHHDAAPAQAAAQTDAPDPDAPTKAPEPRVTLEPPPHAAASRNAMEQRFTARPTPADHFRRELGLPTGRPLILTGHQPGFFHPGVLAKYITARELAARSGAAVAMLVVDHDAADPFALRVPRSLDDDLPEPIDVRLGPAPRVGAAAESLPVQHERDLNAARDQALRKHDLAAEAAAMLDAAVHALVNALHHHPADGAEQAAIANAHLLGIADLGPLVRSSELAAAHAFAEFARSLATDDDELIAYNRAVAAHPDAGVTPLAGVRHADPQPSVDEDAELPLWSIDPATAVRRAVRRDGLAHTDPATLRPRALCMTALLRRLGCELFIHGTGGAAYDHATTQWRPEPLAPVATATADLYLPNEPADHITQADVAHARWLAHHARHSPAAVNDHQREQTRRTLVANIRNANTQPARSAAFRHLHDFLNAHRSTHAEALQALAANADRLARTRHWQISNAGRTLPAFAYPASQRQALATAVRDAVNATIR
jgi:hypothetical protein